MTKQISGSDPGSGDLVAAAVLGLFGVGLLALAGPRLALAVAGVERWRLRLSDDGPTPSRRSGNLYSDPATWRSVAYLLLLAAVVPVWLGVLAVVGLLVVATPLAVSLTGQRPAFLSHRRSGLPDVLLVDMSRTGSNPSQIVPMALWD